MGAVSPLAQPAREGRRPDSGDRVGRQLAGAKLGKAVDGIQGTRALASWPDQEPVGRRDCRNPKPPRPPAPRGADGQAKPRAGAARELAALRQALAPQGAARRGRGGGTGEPRHFSGVSMRPSLHPLSQGWDGPLSRASLAPLWAPPSDQYSGKALHAHGRVYGGRVKVTTVWRVGVECRHAQPPRDASSHRWAGKPNCSWDPATCLTS